MRQKNTKSPILMFIGITAILLLTYFATPKLYIELKTKEYNESFKALTTDLTTNPNYKTIANQYALENNAIVCITNKNTNDIYSTTTTKVYHSYQKNVSIITSTSTSLAVDIQYTFNQLEDLENILIIILPCIGVLLYGFYLLLPTKKTSGKESYKDLYEASEQMMTFNPKARLPIHHSSATKQKLAININQVYELMLAKKEQYDALNQDYQILLEKSKTTLLETQQETNQAIQTILDDVKGMLNNQGKYRNPNIYLMELKVKLEDVLNHKKQPVKLPGTIREIFEKLLEPYKVLAQEKFIIFTFQFENNFKVKVDDLLFHQAMGCLMTFILNQCDEHSLIKIIQDDYNVHIQYKGACLAEESIQQVEQIDQNVIDAYRYVKQMGFFIDYSQTQEKDGMQFTFHF